jgi:hypothetical protein
MPDQKLTEDARRAVETHVSRYLGRRLLALGAINLGAILTFGYQFFVALPDKAERAGTQAAGMSRSLLNAPARRLR